jgi:site-specific DNA-methyltransferase (adenine-specific)
MHIRLEQGDSLQILKYVQDNSIDSCVCDPPYGIKFLGKKWDHDVPSVELWKEVFRVLKPGAHLLSFFGTRTYHRGVTNLEDAGFEIRDQIGWAFGSGFPKSMDLSKAIDRELGSRGEKGEVKGKSGSKRNCMAGDFAGGEYHEYIPGSDEANAWKGWGTALKPAWEPIVLARKPFKGTFASNVLKHGTGALNIDGCRIEGEPWKSHKATGLGTVKFFTEGETPVINKSPHELGRWPANFIHNGDEEVVELLGDAARFFYCAKASVSERDEGLSDLEDSTLNRVNPGGIENDPKWAPVKRKNNHPTVKPIKLMSYLCRLITPPGGTVLDPFMGSGSTGVGAVKEGFNFVGIELDPHFLEIAKKRIEHHNGKKE